MKTTHQLHTADARDLAFLPDESVHLVVTSPPYPMVAMWDEAFSAMAPEAAAALAAEDGPAAFVAMHTALDAAWASCHRVLVPGGLLCLNIGDATRSLGGRFRLYPNHARIVSAALSLGFDVLPDILWRKPTNAPSKFMGSGMLPPGAYVTYEHEYVLILRKGDRRAFSTAEDRARRSRSAYFWEERNTWFSDLWADLPGTGQRLDTVGARERSAAFPFALPWRLIQMFSLQGDTVLDPFAGTGTTLAAALVAGRSSIGTDLSPPLLDLARARLKAALAEGPAIARARLAAHKAFVAEREALGRPCQHFNELHGFAVMTGQERQLELLEPVGMEDRGGGIEVGYRRVSEETAVEREPEQLSLLR